MEKCEYYKVKEFEQPICANHKYHLECNCGGDRKKCDYFLVIREEARQQEKENKYMNTAEMWLKAQEDGKIYYCGPLEYQKDFGLRFSETKGIPDRGAWISLNQFMKEQWYSCPIMTKSEAEAKFNIKIVGD